MGEKLYKLPKFRFFVRIVLLWVLILLFIKFSFVYGLDKKAVTVGIIIFGFLSQAFAGLLSFIGLIPILGPVLVKVLSWPIFLTINGLAYVVTFFAIKSGLIKETVNSKLLVSILLLGMLLGFILGKVF